MGEALVLILDAGVVVAGVVLCVGGVALCDHFFGPIDAAELGLLNGPGLLAPKDTD